MPSVDYRALRAAITITEVLDLIGFEPNERRGDQVRGGCPVHGSSSPKSRSFSANLAKNTYQCFKCGSKGNQLDLWAAVTKTQFYDAALGLCAQLSLDVPYLVNQSSRSMPSPKESTETEKRNP